MTYYCCCMYSRMIRSNEGRALGALVSRSEPVLTGS